MTVRLEELLAAATPGEWPADLRGILRFDSRGGGYVDTADAALIALCPDAVRLLIDMGEALALLEGAMRFEEDAAMFDQEAKPLLARLDRLGTQDSREGLADDGTPL